MAFRIFSASSPGTHGRHSRRSSPRTRIFRCLAQPEQQDPRAYASSITHPQSGQGHKPQSPSTIVRNLTLSLSEVSAQNSEQPQSFWGLPHTLQVDSFSMGMETPEAGTRAKLSMGRVGMPYTYDRRASHNVEMLAKGSIITFRVGGAELHVRANGPDFKVISVEAPTAMRGQGVGKALYRAMFTEAQRQGKGAISDLTVEEPAARVWESLKREGFPIEKNPKPR